MNSQQKHILRMLRRTQRKLRYQIVRMNTWGEVKIVRSFSSARDAIYFARRGNAMSGGHNRYFTVRDRHTGRAVWLQDDIEVERVKVNWLREGF